MKIDVLLNQLMVIENGSERKSTPGLLMVSLWPAPIAVQNAHQGGRPLVLRDQEVIAFSGYENQFELRSDISGKTRIDVQVVSLTDYALFGVIVDHLGDLATLDNPILKKIIDQIIGDIKKGSPQVIAQGSSDWFDVSSVPRDLTIQLSAPKDVLGAMDNQGGPEGQIYRPVLMSKDTANGSIQVRVQQA